MFSLLIRPLERSSFAVAYFCSTFSSNRCLLNIAARSLLIVFPFSASIRLNALSTSMKSRSSSCSSMNLNGGRLIISLAIVIVVLQIIHLILLNRLENKNRQRAMLIAEQLDIIDSSGDDVETTFMELASKMQRGRVLDTSGEFQIVSNIAASVKKTSPADITLITQCSHNHLYFLMNLIGIWQGPLSVAVYSEDEELPEALWNIANLRSCCSLVKNLVTFHLVSPLPARSSSPVTIPPSLLTRQPCKFLNSTENNYARAKSYPNNLLRNVARKNTVTNYIFVIDIDILPSANLRQDFISFASRKGLFHKNYFEQDRTVFVVPAFEVKTDVTLPMDKAQLLQFLDVGIARPFYIEVCHKCQKPTNYEAWQMEKPASNLSPMFEVLWRDPWEPFYIAPKNVPLYDERFKQYGFNRISQVCELHIAGYTFAVLNNAFVVHQGWKTTNSFHSDKDYDLERNRILFRQFKQELKIKYPESSRRCY